MIHVRGAMKSERRAVQLRKARYAPRGGTAGSQRKLLETRKYYAGSVKLFIRKRKSGT